MKTCRNCEFSKQQNNGDLVCQFKDTPAAHSGWRGICARLSGSPKENAKFDVNCYEFAELCHRYQQEAQNVHND